MKFLKKLLVGCLFAFSFFVFSSAIKLEATTVNTIRFHYFRYDNTYNDWYTWFWSESQAGTSSKLTNKTSAFGYVSEFNVAKIDASEKLGVLFVKSTSSSGLSWGGEQTNDFYFYLSDVTPDVSGVANVYYSQGDEKLTFNENDATEAKKEKFLYLTFTSDNTISYTTTGGSITNLHLYADNEEVSATLNKSTITLANNLDYSKTYTIDCTIGKDVITKAEVGFTGIYQTASFENAYGYDGTDLGANYTSTSTTFKLWAPISKDISLNLYHYGHPTKYGTTEYPGDDTAYQVVEMTKGEKGVWQATVEGDLDGIYYTYSVNNGSGATEVTDPYSKATGVNGLRSMVVNFSSSKLNPTGFKDSKRATATTNNVDKVIYETQIRDLTADSSWGGKKEWSGTYLGLSQRGTTYSDGTTTVSTGLDHLIELGITDLHILPVMDSEYVDETKLNDEEYKNKDLDGIYNWGYMTKYFFSIDGCFSTNPYDGYTRLYEYKTMIQTLHENGINIVMDVVFNHTSTAGNSNFHKIVPYYYHRTSLGHFTNGSGCGNEMASERYMVNKLIVDSVSYFAEEFKVDGFRFDLMALEDVKTMNDVYKSVSSINPNTIIYGEPWTGDGSSGYANKANMNKMPNVAAFSDVTREGIRGNNDPGAGWIQGSESQFDRTVYGIVGGAGYCNSAYSEYTFTSPNQIVNYASCHDNYALFDQIKKTTGWSLSSPKMMNAVSQALSIILTSQGVPFIEGGSELGRSKRYQTQSGSYDYNHNSYNAGDKINSIIWDKKITNLEYVKAIEELIKIRKNHTAFRQTTYQAINNVLVTPSGNNLYYNNGNTIAYRLKDNNDIWKDIYVIHNNATAEQSLTLPKATGANGWKIVYSNQNNKIDTFVSGTINLKQNESVILIGNNYDATIPDNPVVPTPTPSPVDPVDPSVTFDKELYNAFMNYLEQINLEYSLLVGISQQSYLVCANNFLNASYQNKTELDAAWQLFRTLVKDIK